MRCIWSDSWIKCIHSSNYVVAVSAYYMFWKLAASHDGNTIREPYEQIYEKAADNEFLKLNNYH